MTIRVPVSIPIQKSRSYAIHIGAGAISDLPKWLKRHAAKRRIVVVGDATALRYHGKQLLKHISPIQKKTLVIEVTPGEKSKTQTMKSLVERRMTKAECGRDTLLIAFGGGVVGDLAGFVAATYMRGIPYIQIPTTLLAMVDSSVGGKTGIDTDEGKNLIGAFWQPSLVIADTHFLESLSTDQIVNGLIEAIKMALTHDAKGFHYIIKHLDTALDGDARVLTEIIKKAVRIKAGVVARDETESGERMALNFGHTIGHALEYATDYRILHGIAVALGILVEAKSAELLGLLSSNQFELIRSLLSQLSISGDVLDQFDLNKIMKIVKIDKKSKLGKAQYVLLRDIGRVYDDVKRFAHPVSDAIVRQAFQLLTGA